jgi:hypothetical protein
MAQPNRRQALFNRKKNEGRGVFVTSTMFFLSMHVLFFVYACSSFIYAFDYAQQHEATWSDVWQSKSRFPFHPFTHFLFFLFPIHILYPT